MDEEVVLLEEQLATAHAEVERLQTEVADLAAKQAQHDEVVAGLRSQLETALAEREAARGELAAQAEEAERLRQSVESAETQGREALQRYRQSLLEREPQLPADLVSGESVPELEAAVERARQTVARVRQHLDEQAQAVRVPAGSPARGSPDVSDLSASEKIRHGLSKTS